MSNLTLPLIQELRRICQSLAMLEAIVSPEWESRYYSYNGAWDSEEEMASMRNGSGDDWFLLFSSAGAALKGFDHELQDGGIVAANIQKEVPASFSSFLSEPAFSMQNATFCYWRRTEDQAWSKVSAHKEEDGSKELLSLLVNDPTAYVAWAEEYYEVAVPKQAAIAIYAHEPLTPELIKAINPGAKFSDVVKNAGEIGYPVAIPRQSLWSKIRLRLPS